MDIQNSANPHKHPLGLWYLAISYSLLIYAYVVINTLLVLYGSEFAHLKTADVYSLYAAFNALVFTSPLVGGYISEKFGYKNSAAIGLLFSMIGVLLIGLHTIDSFYLGLAVFTVGYGLCTPAFFCLVGLLYAKDDSRRDSGYTLFYLIFNIGSALAAISAGYISRDVGYQTSFFVAAAALLVGLIILLLTKHMVKAYSTGAMQAQIKWRKSYLIFSLVVIAIIFSPLLLPLFIFPTVNNTLLWILVIAACIGVLWLAKQQQNALAKYRLIIFILLTVISSAFWALYMLESSLMTLFAEFNVNRQVLGHIIPPSVFYSLDPLGVIIFGVVLSWLWRYLSEHNRNPSLPAKFSLALIFMGTGFVVFSIGCYFANVNGLVNPLWVVFGYVFLTIAELLISPIGMSMVGRLSPAGKEGRLMGVWTLFTGFGAVLSGYLANITTQASKTTSAAITTPIYVKYFVCLGLAGIIIGLILFMFVPRLKNLIHQP